MPRLEADLQAPANFVQLKHFEILSWLIANEYLDIKIAVPIISKQDARTTDKGIPIESDRLLDPQHIFHEKVGIFICDRLGEHLVSTNQQMLAYKLQDIWKKGTKIVNPKKLAKDTPFINASRQYLTVNTPLKDLMFRHTRDTLRQYYKLGILDRDIPRRIVSDNAIALEPNREVPLYQAVSDYVRHFYRLAQKENRKALGFLMTLYRKRLTSSFYAIRESLQRRLEGIKELPLDDLSDLDDADDAVITGLEAYLAEPVDPKEIEYLEDLLRQFENTGEDSKLSHFLTILRQELSQRESAIVFTQYTQ